MSLDVLTLCMAECAALSSSDWIRLKLPGVTSSHKADLWNKTLQSTAESDISYATANFSSSSFHSFGLSV